MVYHITGAAGYFAGNYIYHNKEYLKKNGCRLYDFKDLPEQLQDFNDCFIKGDINITLYQTFNPGDILINFASFSHVDESFLHPYAVKKNNCLIGMTLNSIVRKNPFLYVVHISTDEITTRSSPYSESKYQQELELRALKSDRIAILRFNNLYGNGENYPIIQIQPCLIPNTIKQKSIIKQGNTKTNTRNFMYIGDAINYVDIYTERLISDKSVFRIYDLYYGRTYTVAQIHEMLETLFNKYNINYNVVEKPDRKINDESYPSINTFDETEETFKRHLEETFKFIINQLNIGLC